jgi:hypothetical protein|eukprot:COSAG06_NODE_552_length_14385_cov_7.790424_8_plen_89_part_00
MIREVRQPASASRCTFSSTRATSAAGGGAAAASILLERRSGMSDLPSCSGCGGSPAISMNVGVISIFAPIAVSRVPGMMPGPRAKKGM